MSIKGVKPSKNKTYIPTKPYHCLHYAFIEEKVDLLSEYLKATVILSKLSSFLVCS